MATMWIMAAATNQHFKSHTYKTARCLPYAFCTGCGLLRLRNPLTDWCDRNGCNHADLPGYAAAVRSLSAQVPK